LVGDSSSERTRDRSSGQSTGGDESINNSTADVCGCWGQDDDQRQQGSQGDISAGRNSGVRSGSGGTGVGTSSDVGSVGNASSSGGDLEGIGKVIDARNDHTDHALVVEGTILDGNSQVSFFNQEREVQSDGLRFEDSDGGGQRVVSWSRSSAIGGTDVNCVDDVDTSVIAGNSDLGSGSLVDANNAEVDQVEPRFNVVNSSEDASGVRGEGEVQAQQGVEGDASRFGVNGGVSVSRGSASVDSDSEVVASSNAIGTGGQSKVEAEVSRAGHYGSGDSSAGH